METITHKGVTLAYEDQGAGERAYLFVHGWSCNRSFFIPQIEHFAQKGSVLSIDLRGHGESDKPQGEYPISAYCDDLHYLIERLNINNIIAIGHSMGALTVLQLATRHLRLSRQSLCSIPRRLSALQK